MAKNPTQRNNQSNQVVATHQTVTHYQGAVPHPDILRGFDELVPGAAARLIKLAEDEAEHRRKIETMAIDANIATQQNQLALGEKQQKSVFRSDLIGQVFGLIVCLSSIAAAIYLGINGHDWLAGAIAAIPTAALIQAFALSKK